MIELCIHQIVQDLGATGVLVVGLFLILHGPLKQMAKSLNIINHEIGEIKDLLKAMKKENT